MDVSPRRSGPKPGILANIFFVLSLPFGLLFLLGELFAWPLEKYRHRHVALWLTWNLLRSLSPSAVLGLALLYFFRRP